MTFADLSRTVLRVQYQIARAPLALIEKQLTARLDSDARLRLFYQRSLGLLDALAGNVLDSPSLARRDNDDRAKRQADARRRPRCAGECDYRPSQFKAPRCPWRSRAGSRGCARGESASSPTSATHRPTAQARGTQGGRSACRRGQKASRRHGGRRNRAADAAKQMEPAVLRADEKLAEADAQAKLDDAQHHRNVAARKRVEADGCRTMALRRESQAPLRAVVGAVVRPNPCCASGQLDAARPWRRPG